ncbi:MAG TPA: VWA domain-containing protein [Solirubrobacteraceae bacterium]|nr:VWA domain-containing protein [Solirubrobacteraceae bacterium]
MSFSDPAWLGALVLIPVAVAALIWARRRARRYAVRFTAVSTLQLAVGPASSWRRRLPAVFLLAALAALAFALARPRVTYSAPVNEAAVMLVSDESGSMASTDVQPSRLAAAERAATSFIDQLPAQARVGAIAFSTAPNSVQAPVADHSAARSVINSQSAGGATDTGDSLALALQLLHGAQPKHPPSAVVLLSDGAANQGEDPTTVARQAAADRIPIYTVALGTPGGMLPGAGPFGGAVPVPPDPQLMAQIAQLSGGRSFNAQSADELSSIYKGLARKLGTVPRKRTVSAEFALGGLVLLLVALAGGTRWSPRLP